MIRARLAFSLLSGFALLSATGCATAPSGPSATAYDLRIDASLGQDQSLQRSFLIVVTPAPRTTPAPANSVIEVRGSLTFSQGPQPSNSPMLANWTCSGPWAAFICTTTLTAMLNDEGGYLPISFAPPPPGTTVTYTVTVRMNDNTDPDPTNDSYTFTHGL